MNYVLNFLKVLLVQLRNTIFNVFKLFGTKQGPKP